jgi:hypothetical protein
MASTTKHVFRWDLDKTYLKSEFATLKDLIKSALETANDKRSFPGASALLRALRQSPGNRICIISGSPSQMRSVLSAKLALDGIDFDEFVLKNNLENLKRLRFRAIRSQVPYKLPALLESRSGISGFPPETLFGDDAEADAIIYSLYADILSDRISPDELTRVMSAARAYEDQVEKTMQLYRQVARKDTVRRILIHLDQRSPTARFAHFGRRLVPIFNYFQAALVLYGDETLSAPQVLFVAKEMLESREFAVSNLANSMQDLLRRGRVSLDTASALCLELGTLESGAGGVSPKELAWALAERVRQLGNSRPLEWPADNPVLDYVSLVDSDYQKRAHP